jgi:hypothetical protein
VLTVSCGLRRASTPLVFVSVHVHPRGFVSSASPYVTGDWFRMRRRPPTIYLSGIPSPAFTARPHRAAPRSGASGDYRSDYHRLLPLAPSSDTSSTTRLSMQMINYLISFLRVQNTCLRYIYRRVSVSMFKASILDQRNALL